MRVRGRASECLPVNIFRRNLEKNKVIYFTLVQHPSPLPARALSLPPSQRRSCASSLEEHFITHLKVEHGQGYCVVDSEEDVGFNPCESHDLSISFLLITNSIEN